MNTHNAHMLAAVLGLAHYRKSSTFRAQQEQRARQRQIEFDASPAGERARWNAQVEAKKLAKKGKP